MPNSETGSSASRQDRDVSTKVETRRAGWFKEISMDRASILSTPPREITKNDIEKGDADLSTPQSVHSEFNPEDPPDGGLEAWLVVFGGFLVLFCTFGIVNCSGIFIEYYLNGPLSHYSSSSVTWITSVQNFIVTGSNLIMGRIFDNYGTRWTLPIGTIFYTFGLMVLSLSTEYYQIILSQGVVCGIGAAAVFNCANNATMTWFNRNRATALGIVYAGSSIGGVVLPITMSHLIPRIGFPWTMRLLGFIVLGFCGIACFTVKSYLPPRPKPFVFHDLVKPFREPRFALLAAGSFFVLWGMYLPINFLTIQAKELGVKPGLVPYILPVLNALSMPGRILPGVVADRLGRFNMMLLICFLSTTITLALWIPGNSTAAIMVFAAIYGFASGGYISLNPVVTAQISDLREIGSRSGVVLFISSLGVLTGPPIGGAILSAQHGNYLGLKLWTGLCMFVGGLLFFASRTVQVKFRIVKI
ncbi:monocarboxylate permease-like protein [Xylaria nigripes]|nr:monocarboxylate permease-like protein [Xylaria nigripes]